MPCELQGKIDMEALLSRRNASKKLLQTKTGLSKNTILNACKGVNITAESANAIAKSFGKKRNEIFTPAEKEQNLSTQTLRHYYQFLS
ncbi:MAG: hypothetical protein RR992_02135 [Clostridiales bacterium]